MKAKMRNLDIIMDYLPALRELKSMRTGTRIAYNVVRSEKQAVERAKEYDETRLTLLNNHCLKQDGGQPMIKEGNYQFETDDARSDMETKIRDLAEEEVEVEVWGVTIEELDRIPDISGNLLDRLMKYSFVTEPNGKPNNTTEPKPRT